MERYLAVKEVAALLGIQNASSAGVKLPAPDAMIGRTRGWKHETIEEWRKNRPGRGVGGGRPKKTQCVASS
ncbi:hypothetical protein [Bifidobacterium magnum]|uniref:Uncharacterized protein n=1 Tax=Bifidobacterium magnum TaxID=1692 RepID=A0A087B9A4_9BIFI|nr:hypothetical protein [Bifidobacterium magnum]KFI67604.1 hypothetical protein BMAGN_5006 [Bifidobacterium magnum]